MVSSNFASNTLSSLTPLIALLLVCVTTTARAAMEHGYDVVIVKDAIGDRDIPSLDGKSTTKAETLVEGVCTELNDFFGTVLQAKDIKV
jgi:hypothetical protein